MSHRSGGARCPSLDRLGTLSEVERATRPMRLGDKPLHLDPSLHYVSLSNSGFAGLGGEVSLAFGAFSDLRK